LLAVQRVARRLSVPLALLHTYKQALVPFLRPFSLRKRPPSAQPRKRVRKGGKKCRKLLWTVLSVVYGMARGLHGAPRVCSRV